MKLLSETFRMTDDFLAWKYHLNPDFDQSLVLVAMDRGKAVGGIIWLPRNLKISRSLAVKAMLGADLVVDRNHRGQGLAKPLIAAENRILEGKNGLMSYGFIDPRLVERVHGPLIGLVEVPTSTTVYKKYLGLSEIRQKVMRMNKMAKSEESVSRKLPDLDVTVSFHLKGMSPFILRIGPDGVSMEENALTDPSLKVKCDLTPSELFNGKSKNLTLIRALLTRRLRVKGSLKKAIILYRLSRLLGVLLE